ncbi:unnamed protein product [Vitrella brassicaformis CCMP3155]|uniref:V-type proton ATPase subunit C n=2 Tax=Vitrella brassicaformis TaxID=1169539 RepID=A0A0G4GA96_VITBC|nr:unnamed protein product [Vitrella brassicaformis CCMP3155]|mmetsp:Transcript_51127/g.128349  ORF Transcript_51127/g.128349 Transcript_51127/m.128349 type:complete len:385 (+) Transcript_51127:164-1318(+)|eukprot:CEM25559.1 unnamed protein product [Vitrella brassicaformis CCMP3155]
MSFWIVACSSKDESRDSIFSVLKSRIVPQLASDLFVLDVPDSLKVGTFDSLIKVVDELAKHDTMAESVLRRVERQLLEIDPNTQFKIMAQRTTATVDDYLRRFVWDEAKFPKKTHVTELIQLILASVGKIDEELRLKSAAFNDLKQQASQVAKKEGGNLSQRDLIDVLTPEVVKESDFIESEYLTTLVVVVPRGQDKEWLEKYEGLDEHVVPRSSQKLPPEDREGNTLWRVVVMKKSAEDFKSTARQNRFIVRDFTYSVEAYNHRKTERARIEQELKKNESFLKRVCEANFSDVFIAWVHLKAIRVFVEAVLRFGLPPKIAAFFLMPTGRNEKRLRQELETLFTSSGSFGKSYAGGAGGAEGHEMEGGEYYPYVSLTFTPLSQK